MVTVACFNDDGALLVMILLTVMKMVILADDVMWIV
jgi:hypothetical protein